MNSYIFEQYRAPFRGLELWHVELDAGDFSPHEYQEKRIKPYGEWFTPEEAKQVEAMALCTGFYLKKPSARPDSRFFDLSIFEKLKFLSLPVYLLPHVDLVGCAGSLLHLHIADAQALPLPSAKRPDWPMSRAVLPKVKALDVFCPLTRLAEFSIQRFPFLEWISVGVDGESSVQFLKELDKAAKLTGLGLTGLNSKKISLAPVRDDLCALRLEEMQTTSFDFKEITRFRDLQYLEIVDCRTAVDCAVFTKLPLLEELTLEACDEVTNCKALLEIPRLKRLHLFGRLRPYGKDMSRGFIEKLQENIAEVIVS